MAFIRKILEFLKFRAMLPRFPILDLLQDCYDPPLTPDALEDLQAKLGKRFPREYADFLLEFNGGHFTREVEYSVPEPTQFVSGGLIDAFIGEPNDGYDTDGLVWYAQTLDDRISEDYLAIAHCNTADQVLLKLVGPDSKFEGVWHWDHSAMCVSEDEQAYYWLADSFYEFLSMLAYDVTFDEEERETLPLFQAIERGAITAVERYVAAGGDIEARNKRGQTLLMAAAIYRWPQIVRFLLNRSANPNARDLRGRSPLHHAAEHSIDSVKLLLAAGADATARDRKGKSVLSGWSYRGDQILRAHGATE